MKVHLKNVITIVLLLVNYMVFGQYLDMELGRRISNLNGDELGAEWSPDGSRLLFQSVEEGQSKVFIYYLEKDTMLLIDHPDFNFRNPVWHPDGNRIVFDSYQNSHDFIFVYDLESYQISKLFNRKINCKAASFSSSSRQVFFNGYDELAGRWEIYSYDFIYDNLNKLTETKFGVGDPDISSDGKLISISKTNPFNSNITFGLINWYGEKDGKFVEVDGEYAIWGPVGLKVYFIDDKGGNNELYSIWKNGTHLEKLTDTNRQIASPAVSPDGTKIALSVKTDHGWDIFLLLFEDY